MSEYKLNFTDVNIPSIVVDEKDIDNSSVDITLFGFKRLNYGEELNENFIHLLENFAVPEDPTNTGNPDTSQTNYISSDNNSKLLANGKQVTGQIWYNKTNSSPYVYYDNKWHKLEIQGEEIAANWGQILNGEQIPRPVSNDGFVFPYSQSSWIVAPANQLNELEQMICRTDENANVIMEYLFSGDSVETSAVANYMIVGIRGNNNLGSIQDPTVPVPTPTPTPSTSVGASPPPSPTPPPTPTPSASEEAPAALSITMNDPFSAFCGGDQGSKCTASKQLFLGGEYKIIGGSGNFSYNWSYNSGDVFSISNSSIAEPTLSRKLTTGLTGSGFGTLTVTDNDTSQIASEQFRFDTTHIENTPDPSSTPTPTPSTSSGTTPTPTPTPTPSISESATPTPTPTPSTSSGTTPTPTPSISESATPTPTPTPTPSTSSTIGNVNAQSIFNIIPLNFTDPSDTGEVRVRLLLDGTMEFQGVVNSTIQSTVSAGDGVWVEGGFAAGTDGNDYTVTTTSMPSTDPATNPTFNPIDGTDLGGNLDWGISGISGNNGVTGISFDINITGPSVDGVINVTLQYESEVLL